MTVRDSGNYTNDFKTKWFFVEKAKVGSIHLKMVGTASGSVSVEWSNDPGDTLAASEEGEIDSDSTLALSGSDSHFFALDSIPGRWVRLNADNTGTGTFTADFLAKR